MADCQHPDVTVVKESAPTGGFVYHKGWCSSCRRIVYSAVPVKAAP